MIGIIAISTKCDSRQSLRPCCSHPCDSQTCSPALKLYDHHDHRETLLQHAKTLVHQRGSISSSYTDHLWTFPSLKEAFSPGLSISYFREPPLHLTTSTVPGKTRSIMIQSPRGARLRIVLILIIYIIKVFRFQRKTLLLLYCFFFSIFFFLPILCRGFLWIGWVDFHEIFRTDR